MNPQSLETEGAKIGILLFLLIFLITVALFMHETGHDPKETGRVLLSNAFTSVSTLLLAKLGKQP